MSPIEFARNLFLLRREHKMTAEELADAMEVTPELICEWECAKTSPTLEQITRLAKVYGISPADMVRTPKTADLPEEAFPAPAPEPQPEPEEDLPAPSVEPEIGKKKKVLWWEIVIILLLLLIIAAAAVFLIKPEWFPLKTILGNWIFPGLNRIL